MKILGITLNSELKADEDIESSKTSSLTSLQTLMILKAHGFQNRSNPKSYRGNNNVQNYAAPAWKSLTQASDILKIDKLQRKLKGIEYASHDQPTVES